jgi:hypothetical protein
MKQRANAPGLLAGLLAGLLGTAALGLPCIDGKTPFYYGGPGFFPCDWEIAIMAWGVFLAVPILIWHIFRYMDKAPFKGETAILYTLSALAMLPPLLISIITAKYIIRGEATDESLLLIVPIPLLAANIALLWRSLKTERAAETTCGNFLLGAYVPNALTAVIFAVTFPLLGSWKSLNTGAYLVLAACALCVGSVIFSMSTRQGISDEGTGQDKGQTKPHE